MAPKVGLEPTTIALTVRCSTTELLRNNFKYLSTFSIIKSSEGIVNTFFIYICYLFFFIESIAVNNHSKKGTAPMLDSSFPRKMLLRY